MAAQNNMFDVIDDEVEELDLDAQFSASTDSRDLEEASDEDKEKAAANGKADSKEDIAKKEALALKEKLQKEDEEARKKADEFILGDPDKKKDNKKTDSKPNDDLDTDSDIEPDTIEAIAQGLYKVGIFQKDSEDEEPPKTEEEFLAKMDSEAENRADEKVDAFAGRYGEDYRKAFDVIFRDGADPREYLAKFEEVRSWKDLDLKEEANQEKVVRAALRKQGWEEDDIEEKVKSMKLNSELETDSQRYHKAFVRNEEANLVKIQQESADKLRQKQAKENQYKTNVENLLVQGIKTKTLGGIPVTKEIAVTVNDMLTAPKWKLPSGELITNFDAAILELNNPQNHAAKVQLGLLLRSFKSGEPIKLDLSTITKVAESNENKDIFNFKVRNKSDKNSNKSTSDTTRKSAFDEIDD